MIKKFLFLAVVFFLMSATTTSLKKKKNKTVHYPVNVDYNIPYLDKNFVAFKEAVAFKESQGKYSVVNTLGYLGKYQFGKNTLKRIGIYNTDAFLKNPELQEKAFVAYCKVNKWILRKDIKRSVGKTINGIKITESGILAAAHLGGAGNVKKFLRSNGETIFEDAYGATISQYLKKFSNYNVANITADRKAKV
ncbi:peptidoglycan-binding protein LysM [Polaribacter sp.]|uniref:peptidoglycan-binding protein LysM n=1 Tax=Polaribacter sp. TaxID=1920175 RepID=UPI003F698414